MVMPRGVSLSELETSGSGRGFDTASAFKKKKNKSSLYFWIGAAVVVILIVVLLVMAFSKAAPQQ